MIAIIINDTAQVIQLSPAAFLVVVVARQGHLKSATLAQTGGAFVFFLIFVSFGHHAPGRPEVRLEREWPVLRRADLRPVSSCWTQLGFGLEWA